MSTFIILCQILPRSPLLQVGLATHHGLVLFLVTDLSWNKWGVISVSSPVFIFVEAFQCGGTKFEKTLATDSHSIGQSKQCLNASALGQSCFMVVFRS